MKRKRHRYGLTTIDEMINATGGAFLGMTLSCARCHDHKFDPISQQDYYQLHATFAGVRHGAVPWATQEAKRRRAAILEPLNREKATLEKKLDELNHKVLGAFHGTLGRIRCPMGAASPPTEPEQRIPFHPPLPKRFGWCVSHKTSTWDPRWGWRIDEFEVWSAGNNPRNVGLNQQWRACQWQSPRH